MDLFNGFTPNPMALYFGILSITLISLFYLLRRKQNPLLPPGKTGWPIIGETVEFATSANRGTPEKFVNDRTSKYGSKNVFRTSLIGENVAVFCGPSGNKFLFSNEDKYVRSWWPRFMEKLMEFPPNLEPDYLNRETSTTRSLILDFLKPEALQRYVPIMDRMAKRHFETDWSPYTQVKVLPLVKKYAFAVTCRIFMNVTDPDQVRRLVHPFEIVTKGIMSVPVNLPGTMFNKAIKGVKIIRKELGGICKMREEEEEELHNDYLSRLLREAAKDEGPLKKETIVGNKMIGLLIASHETTSSAITFVISYLAEFPYIYDRVFAEQMEIAKSKGPNELLDWEDLQKMKYSWMVACEAMRLLPPAQGSFREAIKDFTFSGYTIPKGWKTYWTVNSTHKNAKYFPDPERFDPSRFEGNGPPPYTFVPFGGGPRMCPGKEFARLEILVFMHNMVTNFKCRKVIPDEKILYLLAAAPADGLPIFIEPHIKLNYSRCEC